MGWWDDLRIVGSARTTGSNAAALAEVNGTGIYAWRFTTGKELFFGCQLPHRYQIGAPLKPHVHWLADTTETYTGTWTLDYLWANPTQVTPISNKITLTGAISGAKTALVPQLTEINSAAMNQAYGISCFSAGWRSPCRREPGFTCSNSISITKVTPSAASPSTRNEDLP